MINWNMSFVMIDKLELALLLQDGKDSRQKFEKEIKLG